MNYPLALQQIDTQKNPAAYQIGRYISLIKDIKEAKDQSSNILRVKTILENCTEIPSYEKIKSTTRAAKRDIITPFFRALNALPFIKWELCKAKGVKLTPEETEKAKTDIHFFLSLYVMFEWKDYPDMSKVKDERRKRIEENKARKEKAKLVALTNIENKKLVAAQAAKTENTSA